MTRHNPEYLEKSTAIANLSNLTLVSYRQDGSTSSLENNTFQKPLIHAKVLRKSKKLDKAFHVLLSCYDTSSNTPNTKWMIELSNWFISAGRHFVAIEALQDSCKHVIDESLKAKVLGYLLAGLT